MAKEENISTALQWSTNEYHTSSVSIGYNINTFASDILGRDNSQAVLDYYVSNEGSAPIFEYARDIVIDGYDDWYVPTQWELTKGLNYLSPSIMEFLWTSTEYFSPYTNVGGINFSKALGLKKESSTTNRFSYFNKTLTEGKSRVLPFRSFGE